MADDDIQYGRCPRHERLHTNIHTHTHTHTHSTLAHTTTQPADAAQFVTDRHS